MKKIILTIAVISAFAIYSHVNAQGIGVGVKAGANFANQSVTDISTDTKTGFHGGVYVVLAFSEKWALQPELLYSGQGSDWPDSKADFNYMSIPVLLRYKPISVLSIEAGPQFSSLLSAKIDGEDVKESIKNSDFGLAVGATAHLPLGLNAGLRYVWGFTNVSEMTLVSEVKNSMVQLSVGWTLIGAK
ncbi:MAG: PorT family protein [Cyclobacteriaceae bacterium]|nr:PorT family protein [Cyclobacteriaceae bacterium]